jgi:hypothetical protein
MRSAIPREGGVAVVGVKILSIRPKRVQLLVVEELVRVPFEPVAEGGVTKLG